LIIKERRNVFVLCMLFVMLLGVFLTQIFGFNGVLPMILLLIFACFASNRLNNRLHPATVMSFRQEFD